VLSRLKTSRLQYLFWANFGVVFFFLTGWLFALEVCGRLGRCQQPSFNPLASFGVDPLWVLVGGMVVGLCAANAFLAANYSSKEIA
jgi:hypothetical protein